MFSHLPRQQAMCTYCTTSNQKLSICRNLLPGTTGFMCKSSKPGSDTTSFWSSVLKVAMEAWQTASLKQRNPSRHKSGGRRRTEWGVAGE